MLRTENILIPNVSPAGLTPSFMSSSRWYHRSIWRELLNIDVASLWQGKEFFCTKARDTSTLRLEEHPCPRRRSHWCDADTTMPTGQTQTQAQRKERYFDSWDHIPLAKCCCFRTKASEASVLCTEKPLKHTTRGADCPNPNPYSFLDTFKS